MNTLENRFAGRRSSVLRSCPRSFLRSLAHAFCVALMLVASSTSSVFAAGPKVGERAPAFEFQGEDGELYSSTELYGEKGLVVAWFPKAFTPG